MGGKKSLATHHLENELGHCNLLPQLLETSNHVPTLELDKPISSAHLCIFHNSWTNSMSAFFFFLFFFTSVFLFRLSLSLIFISSFVRLRDYRQKLLHHCHFMSVLPENPLLLFSLSSPHVFSNSYLEMEGSSYKKVCALFLPTAIFRTDGLKTD